jgi:hypothetical protein
MLDNGRSQAFAGLSSWSHDEKEEKKRQRENRSLFPNRGELLIADCALCSLAAIHTVLAG